MKVGKDLAEAVAQKVKEVAEARRILEAATERVRAESTEECHALNDFNERCKELDALMEEMRKAAPSQTNWGRHRRGFEG